MTVRAPRFIHAIEQAGFSRLLWTPEVGHAVGKEDLILRLQTVILSALTLINAWYLQNPPWKQVNRDANKAGQFDPDWLNLEAAVVTSLSSACG